MELIDRIKLLMRNKELRLIYTVYPIPVTEIELSVITPLIFQSDLANRNIFIASIIISLLSYVPLIRQSISFIVHHIKRIREARISFMLSFFIISAFESFLFMNRITLLSAILILTCI
ncbi:hypothetical protein M1425_0587 [Sulfolobus islandicus M.14.25]|uniref:Uncharacterized protein n=2 Tax=Saccharolobus islandicus TaxID=43080 RepID=C4KEP2_SACI6|nr:hypothetical protein M1425_0587 [Sulfolobus islandicus M.14.25]ACR41239.1 hypothetical protein M164_0620 [Sulfolobus islandicus M.16.4]